MSMPQRALGGTASNIKVGAIGFGAMSLTWVGTSPSDEQAFACFNTALENGCNFWNLGTFYSKTDKMENLLLLKRYFDKYPENASKVIISVKGGMRPFNNLKNPDSSLENLREELKAAQEALGPHKKIDLFEPARRDKKLSTKQIIENLKTCIDEGLFSHISLSEVGAKTIREATAVHPIAAVEVEYSPFFLDIEHNDVLNACKENDIAVIAYSPVARGMFGGSIKKREDLAEDDIRRHQPRFSEENFPTNLKLTESFQEIAKEKGIPVSQLVMAWELTQYEKLIPIPGSSKPENVKSNCGAGSVKLDKATIDKLRTLVDDVYKKVEGDRYPSYAQGTLFQ